VAADGTVYVAASACSAVLKITPEGTVSVVLRATDGWSPQGVAVAGDTLYVLEYNYVATDRREDWLPRVRKLAPDGTASVIAQVEKREKSASASGERLKFIAGGGALFSLVSLVPQKSPRPGWASFVQQGADTYSLCAALGGSTVVAQAAHDGGELVYRQGIGSELLRTHLREKAAAASQSSAPNTADSPAASSFAGASAGDERDIAGIPFCWCPAGHFTMGSPPSEPERRPGENQVEVTLTKGFWMAKHEATQAEWRQIVGDLPGELTAQLPEGDDLPVGNVNFAETEAFCRKLTEKARAAEELPKDWEFRLPTEAQWEYACRAGTTTATSFGQGLSSTQANFKGEKPYNGAAPGPSLNRAAKVGSYPANPWGLHEMHGNTFEWCRDWYHLRLPGGADPDLYAAKKSATRSEHGDVSRVRRGGCWADEGWPCRSAFRLRFEPERRYDHIGFRVVAVRR
jgi:formylglycine-generating enzyme required for sulfatase activity